MEKENHFFSSTRNLKTILLVSVIIVSICLHNWLFSAHVIATGDDGNTCGCIIFRFDDIRNGYLEKVQIALMNFFMSNNVSVSLGVVVNQISNNSKLVESIDEGYKRGLFEIGVHGWDHIDYTGLSRIEQENSLIMANQKINLFFGGHSGIFIPPYNLFNNNTLLAMQNTHFKILSSAIYYDEPHLLNSTITNSPSSDYTILHMPEMTDFSIFYNGTWVKVPVRFLLSDIDYDLKKYGYSVVMLHPHNFATQVNGTLEDILDYNQLQSLSSIIEVIKNKNIKIMTFSEAISSIS